MIRFLFRLFFHIAATAAAFLTAAYFLDTVTVSSDIQEIVVLSLIFTAVNVLAKPIIKFILSPIIILTLGLFTVVINAGLLYAVDRYSTALTIDTLTGLLLATVIMSAVHIFLHTFIKD